MTSDGSNIVATLTTYSPLYTAGNLLEMTLNFKNLDKVGWYDSAQCAVLYSNPASLTTNLYVTKDLSTQTIPFSVTSRNYNSAYSSVVDTAQSGTNDWTIVT